MAPDLDLHLVLAADTGQYAHVVGRLDVLPPEATENFLLKENVTGGRDPQANSFRRWKRAFVRCCPRGRSPSYPVVGLAVYLEDGSYHEVNQYRSGVLELFTRRRCARHFPRTKPVLLKPVMKIEIECPSQFQVLVVGNLTSRHRPGAFDFFSRRDPPIEGEVPLAETFGYSTNLRSMTQGQKARSRWKFAPLTSRLSRRHPPKRK